MDNRTKKIENQIYTLKVDASYHLTRRVAGIGIVIHETFKPPRSGMVIDSISELYADIPPSMPERYAILRALELASEREYPRIIIRSDCNHMRKQLKRDLQNRTDYHKDIVHQRILTHAVQFQDIQFPYHPRRKNQEAHKLARYAVREVKPRPRPDMFNEYPILPRAVTTYNDMILYEENPDDEPIPY